MSWRRNPAEWPHDTLLEVTQEDIEMGRRMGRILFEQRLKTFGQEFFSNNPWGPVVLDPLGMGLIIPNEMPPDANGAPPEAL